MTTTWPEGSSSWIHSQPTDLSGVKPHGKDISSIAVSSSIHLRQFSSSVKLQSSIFSVPVFAHIHRTPHYCSCFFRQHSSNCLSSSSTSTFKIHQYSSIISTTAPSSVSNIQQQAAYIIIHATTVHWQHRSTLRPHATTEHHHWISMTLIQLRKQATHRPFKVAFQGSWSAYSQNLVDSLLPTSRFLVSLWKPRDFNFTGKISGRTLTAVINFNIYHLLSNTYFLP